MVVVYKPQVGVWMENYMPVFKLMLLIEGLMSNTRSVHFTTIQAGIISISRLNQKNIILLRGEGNAID